MIVFPRFYVCFFFIRLIKNWSEQVDFFFFIYILKHCSYKINLFSDFFLPVFYSCEEVFLSEARLKLHIESKKADLGISGVLPVSVNSVSFGKSHGGGGGNGGRGEEVVAVK